MSFTNENIPQSYEVLESHFSKDLNSELALVRHRKTGAKVALISNSDENKVFYIGFRTPVSNSTGVPHILEHSVLCGSEAFPIKDPFVELAKGSLNTFLNAMTFPDKTVYPVASCNDKDFQNLMHVYLDAVFRPNIYKHREIFEQEGWRYDLKDKDGELTLNGVVYSEMKGAFSSPDDVMDRQILNSLFPDISYGVESGGDPDVIPSLSYEEFLDFHRTYYHPSNSYIYLYGNMDMAEKLDYIDREYLSGYSKLELDSSIALQEPFKAPVEKTIELPVLDEEDGGTYLTYNVVMGESVDRLLYAAIRILDYAICSAPGAPLKTALVKKGIGKDVYSTYENGIRQQFFSIVAKDTEVSRKEEFLATIKEVLSDIVKNGFSEKALRAAISRMEFSYREADFGSYPKGLVYGLQMLDSWLYDDSKPFLHIEADETFAQLKEKVGTGYFEGLVEKYLLNNPHTSIVIGVPSVGLAAKKEEELKAKLAQYKASLSDAEIEKLISDGRRLLAYQEAEDKEEDLARIPLLEREDLRKTILPLSIREEKADGSSILYHDIFTGGIAYLTVSFDATHLSKEDYPYLSLLKYCFGVMDTENYAYEDLCRETDLYTGILSADTIVVCPVDEESPKLYFDVKTKVLYENIGKAFELIREILFTTKLEDKERLKEILSENRSRLESALISAGHVAAMGRMSSYITEAGDIAESLNGIRFLRFLQQADDHFEECAKELIASLKRVAKALLCKDRMMMSVISPKEADLPVTEEFLKVKQAAYDSESSVESKEPFRANCLNEGFKTPGDVQYVCLGGFADPKKYPYSGALKVLKVILAYDYLWMNVRVKGGAYGCMSAFNRNGVAGFVSYRDPNLEKTKEVFLGIPEYLRSFNGDENIMTKYIIGAMSDMDAPLTPSAEGSRSYLAYRSHVDEALLQKERDEVLHADQDDIRKLADYVEEVLRTNAFCVVGTEGAIEKNKDLFGHIEALI